MRMGQRTAKNGPAFKYFFSSFFFFCQVGGPTASDSVSRDTIFLENRYRTGTLRALVVPSRLFPAIFFWNSRIDQGKDIWRDE